MREDQCLFSAEKGLQWASKTKDTFLGLEKLQPIFKSTVHPPTDSFRNAVPIQGVIKDRPTVTSSEPKVSYANEQVSFCVKSNSLPYENENEDVIQADRHTAPFQTPTAIDSPVERGNTFLAVIANNSAEQQRESELNRKNNCDAVYELSKPCLPSKSYIEHLEKRSLEKAFFHIEKHALQISNLPKAVGDSQVSELKKFDNGGREMNRLDMQFGRGLSELPGPDPPLHSQSASGRSLTPILLQDEGGSSARFDNGFGEYGNGHNTAGEGLDGSNKEEKKGRETKKREGRSHDDRGQGRSNPPDEQSGSPRFLVNPSQDENYKDTAATLVVPELFNKHSVFGQEDKKPPDINGPPRTELATLQDRYLSNAMLPPLPSIITSPLGYYQQRDLMLPYEASSDDPAFPTPHHSKDYQVIGQQVPFEASPWINGFAAHVEQLSPALLLMPLNLPLYEPLINEKPLMKPTIRMFVSPYP